MAIGDPYEELISAVETHILTMAKPDYHFDWDSVGIIDLAQCGSFPNALVEIERIEQAEEQPSPFQNLDNVRVKITVDVQDPSTSTDDNPITTGRAMYSKALADLRKLFGINYAPADGCEYWQFVSAEFPTNASGDVLMSRKLVTLWDCRLYSKVTMD